ncbi:hypothetical protein CBER1_10317 [Cercospora berteroae]|uniref:Uncharacterized protein n=1 Tax=Cercospora berteroae TaxID=357750 RepID=A0A2S6BYA3_9PEZI|nr:hypothetical protein CBER1_10317 [Cercospora berteroae]
MLRARRLPLRIASRPWTAEVVSPRRSFASRGEQPPSQQPNGNNANRDGKHEDSKPAPGAVASANGQATTPTKPSLIEQLFPEETKRYEKQQEAAAREVPKLPLDTLPPIPTARRPKKSREEDRHEHESSVARRLRSAMEHAPPGTAVLVLRNASKNLTPEDFRRLIPQGKHIEGWTLEESDILQVIPERDLSTLEQQNLYYIIFTSQIGAHTYQQHVTRIHKLAAIHTPTSNTSPIPPPPGYMIEGLDAHAAIEAYALKPPSQKLELHQLKRPFTPLVESVVKFKGYKGIVQRVGKMPVEVRLTMDGPQLHASRLKHIFLETGKRRNLSWSGGENFELDIMKWEARVSPSSADVSEFAQKNAAGIREGRESDDSGKQIKKAKNDEPETQPMRTPPHVFIVGFHTEDAAQSFIAYWHKRKLELPNARAPDFEDDSPPVAHVELLW